MVRRLVARLAVVMITYQHTPPQFEPGQLVEHVRYGYRGVVVAVDARCRASQQWYESNQTQPDRAQPWYHVLVDGREIFTYAAETSLRADKSGLPVAHPLVDAFFEELVDGQYVRNERDWDWGVQ
ncbi:MAG: heat shock protein HspQ [Pirellulales bacterium]